MPRPPRTGSRSRPPRPRPAARPCCRAPARADPWIAAAVLSDALPELALTNALQAGAILPVAVALRAQILQ